MTADAHPVLPAQVQPHLQEAHLPRSWEADRGVSSARMSIMSVVLSKLQVWLALSWQLQGRARWPTCGVFVVSGSHLELSRGGLGGLLGTRWCDLSVHHPEELRQPARRAPGLADAALMAAPPPALAAPLRVPPGVGCVFGRVLRVTRPGGNPRQWSSAGHGEPGIHPSCASAICTSS